MLSSLFEYEFEYTINFCPTIIENGQPKSHLIGHNDHTFFLSYFERYKALCHAIRADCLLIEATHAHTVNEQWALYGEGLINSHACSNLPAEACFAACKRSTF